ncbi:NACHT domain-containing NTPase [Candidatus Synechococcus calcipolaris G9]|uniref:NACHT domain-containing NTPase n=1 Tax=Candidatus Synechococcus calcipolaris G9 TaxID=1497997 RepID=A0ABT6EY40_9SYNE|nr:NACHT domain-containing NTPase [Candidatus Synechococcus calcipolaris]MDG2990156.1 NACHT domain-containing NTPase [Candidatus Synechococcus calcipolaris G9]
MGKRSLRASASGIQRAKRAFFVKGWTQDNLAGEVALKTRQPIWRFFTGKPVDRYTFIEICSVLELEWRDIADNPPADFPETGTSVQKHLLEMDALVEKVRFHYRETLESQCGILQLLDVNRPVKIDDIYVDVNILEEIVSLQNLEISDFNNIDLAHFDRIGLGAVDLKQIPGLQAVETYKKLRVLGKPGVGKTTFLKYLAIQCNRGEFARDLVPFFISLRDFCEESKQQESKQQESKQQESKQQESKQQESKQHSSFNLFHYIHQAFITAGIPELSSLDTLLQKGRVLLLLDGLDEVPSKDIAAVVNQIRKFANRNPRNHFIASCRTAAQQLQLQGFTDVEIAPFTQAQITIFAQKWFVAVAQKTSLLSGQEQAEQFIEKLELPDNWQFRQLVVTPLFLHLACWVFQGRNTFPIKRTDFYKQGLDLLLGKWDATKGMERDTLYRDFLVPQKLRLLSHLAAITFTQGQFFFEQSTLENYISDYLSTTSYTDLQSEELELASKAILKAIEAQHGFLIERARGIFSFSYLVFQEYFTARKIVANHNLQSLDQALGDLVSHITDPHWREIFLLTASMLRSADSLIQLMKQRIDALVSEDSYLQEFLMWVSRKSQTIPRYPKLATTRAFYLALTQAPQITKHFTLASTLDQGILLDAALDHLVLMQGDRLDVDAVDACNSSLKSILVMIIEPGFAKALEQLREQLPVDQSSDRINEWCDEYYGVWVEQLQGAIANYRNISHPWEFTTDQQRILRSYYDANQLLVDCLNSPCEITKSIRQDIEATLLLPKKELEDREWE